MTQLHSRDSYTYAFAHLNVRDEVVFKSIVGLLAGRTQSQWQHVQSDHADLLILGAESAAPKASHCKARAVIRIATHPEATDNSVLSVHWPLRASEVYERLEQVTSLLHQKDQGAAILDPQDTYKLTRWPPQEVLAGEPGRLRLATLLGARALSAAELSQRSGMSQQTCLQFLQTLHGAGLLLAESKPASVQLDSAPQGFFARLRAHLGLSARQANTP